MQIRCAHCNKTLAIAGNGEPPAACPHCAQPPGPGRLGAYDPLRLLATGGMGEVWLARHRELGTEVAVKLLPAMPLDQLAPLRARFAREAKLTARVPHPGVVKVHEFGEAGDRPFLVLEFVAGQTLRQRLQGGPLPAVEAARIAAATADVLAAAHADGVLHRDIKPDNVMLQPDGTVRVLDFGIARALHDDAPLTRTGELVGTPEYMAPEQLLDGPEATTERTDVHALGVLLYELLTGRSPFHGGSVFQALKLVESLEPPPPSRSRPNVPPALDRVLAQALAKDPATRTSSAATFAAAVRTAVPAAGRAPTDAASTARLAAPLVAVLLLALVLVVTLPNRPAPIATGPSAAAPAPTLVDVDRLVADGEWQRALFVVERVEAPLPEKRRLAQAAFDAATSGFVRAVGAPDWLAFCDERRRARWFGERSEATTAVTGTAGSDVPAGGAALAQFAQRLPLDSAEHWLAELGAAHLRGDIAAGRHAAGMAWLSGAGELAVLLDGYLQIAPLPDTNEWRRLEPKALERLRQRVAGGDRTDAPAGSVLLALLDVLHGLPLDPEPLQRLPGGLRSEAAAWCRAVAGRSPRHAAALQGLAQTLAPEVRRGG
jgi:hypothetical protein